MRGRSSPRDGRRFDHLRSGNSVSPVSPRSAGSQPERWSAGTHDELGGDAAGCGDRAVSGRLYPGNHRERGDCQPVRREGYCDYPAGTPLAEQADLVLPLLVRENDYIFKPSTSRYAMLAMVDVLATELAMANKPRAKANYAVLSWRSTATAAASIGSRWGLTFTGGDKPLRLLAGTFHGLSGAIKIAAQTGTGAPACIQSPDFPASRRRPPAPEPPAATPLSAREYSPRRMLMTERFSAIAPRHPAR